MTLDDVVNAFREEGSPAFMEPTLRSVCAHAFYSNNGSSEAVTRIGAEPVAWAMAALIGDMRKTCKELGIDFDSLLIEPEPVMPITHSAPSRVQ